MKVGLAFWLIVAISAQEDDLGRCSLTDDECRLARSFSQRAIEACNKANDQGERIEMCVQDPNQIRRRFTAVFNFNSDFEQQCNPCNQSFEGCRSALTVADDCGRNSVDSSPPIQDDIDLDRFRPRFDWHQDEKIFKKKKRQCCVTTKRTVPFVTQCGANCFPVFCPSGGGYQWIDQVVCNIETKQNLTKFGVKLTSRGRCPAKCTTEKTKRAYAVTNLPPEGWFGHCLLYWIPMWFKIIEVPTHCSCPMQFK